MNNTNEDQNLSESVEELRAKLEAMKKLIEDDDLEDNRARNRTAEATRGASIIDGTFLSFVFSIVFILIVSVGFYAYYNLFVAVMKKYQGQHSEL